MLMCNQMGPNMGESSFSQGVGFGNLILYIILVSSKTNITPSFENYELFTGFHYNSAALTSGLCARAQTLLSLPLCSSLSASSTQQALLAWTLISCQSTSTIMKDNANEMNKNNITLPHTNTHTPHEHTNFHPSSLSHKTYIQSSAATEPHPSRYHDSTLLVCYESGLVKGVKVQRW